MIKTLKSELKLRPTYDEMIGMIEAQSDENRPSIETVIDRKATLFRNNQFGSQFDDIDFLGLKKQEEDRAKESVRQAQLRENGIMAGASSGLVSIGSRSLARSSAEASSGFSTPAEVYEATGDDDDDMTSEEATRIRAEMERYLQRQQQTQQSSSSTARTDLDEAHRQSLPAGVEMYRMNTEGTDDMQSLVNIEEGEEEEDFDDDPELIPADDEEETKAPPLSRKHKETIDYSTKITKWQDRSVQEDDIRFQLFLRGIELTPEQEEEITKLKVKGKGRNQTRKDYLIRYIDSLIKSGKWTDQVNDQLLQKRMVEWREMKKGKGKGSGGSRMPREASAEASSSDVVPSQQSASRTAKDILISGAKAGVETLAKAGATALAKSFLPA